MNEEMNRTHTGIDSSRMIPDTESNERGENDVQSVKRHMASTYNMRRAWKLKQNTP